MEEIKAYKPKCGCKNKTYRTKRACISHEKWCIYNPENHACPTCKYNDKDSCNCKLDVIKNNGGESYILKSFVAKHCPYWGFNNEFKR